MLVLHTVGCGANSCGALCGHPEMKNGAVVLAHRLAAAMSDD